MVRGFLAAIPAALTQAALPPPTGDTDHPFNHITLTAADLEFLVPNQGKDRVFSLMDSTSTLDIGIMKKLGVLNADGELIITPPDVAGFTSGSSIGHGGARHLLAGGGAISGILLFDGVVNYYVSFSFGSAFPTGASDVFRNYVVDYLASFYPWLSFKVSTCARVMYVYESSSHASASLPLPLTSAPDPASLSSPTHAACYGPCPRPTAEHEPQLQPPKPGGHG